MKRSEKIRLIKGLLRETVELEELADPEIEVWIQVIGTDSYKYFRTGEIITSSDLGKRKRLNTKIIRMDFVEGKTIL